MRHYPPTHSLGSTLAAATVATLLAPLLGYAATTLIMGRLADGLAAGFSVTLFLVFMAPWVFGFILLCSATLGWVLSFWGFRRAGFFALAGAIVGGVFFGLGPTFIGIGYPFLPWGAKATRTFSVIVGMTIAGAIDGAIFWLVADKLTQIGAKLRQ